MEKYFLNNYVLELLESIEQNLSLYMNAQESDCLHDLRVDIKKINAIFSFAEKIYKAKYHAHLLKPLFHEAGKIRGIQIHRHLLSSTPQPSERLIISLRNKENILCQQFIKNASQYIKLIKNFRKKACLPELLPSKMTIKKHFNILKCKADKMLQNIDRACLHKYRKKIKEIIYVYNALPKRIQKKLEIDVAVFNMQQEWVGEWHDTYATINFLSLGHSSNQKSDYISNLKENEKRQFETLLVNLTNNHK